jgi:hypothetical protein
MIRPLSHRAAVNFEMWYELLTVIAACYYFVLVAFGGPPNDIAEKGVHGSLISIVQ